MSAISQRRTAAAAAIMMLFAVLQFALFTVNPDPAGATHVTPVLVEQTSNLTCSSLAGDGQTWAEVKVDPNRDGVFGDGTLSVTISNTADDKTFDWTSNIGVDAVYVKAGNAGSYLYRYDPPSEATSDTGLTTPGDGTSNGISHISFCYDTEEPDFELPPREDGSCPIPDIDAISAEFDGKVYASGNGPSEVGPVPIDLPAGVYDVYLTSRDTNHSEGYDPDQLFEVFFVRGFFEGEQVWDSPEIRDLEDDEVKITELVASDLQIPQLDSLTAIHAYYPSDFSDSIEPICIVFVPQDDTPPPTPTPVDVVVSGTCVVLADGNVARVTVDDISPDGDVIVQIDGETVAEDASSDFALDTPLSVVASSASGDYAPTTNTDSLTVSSDGCDDDTTPPGPNPTNPPRESTPPLGALGDLVWFDENENGQQDDPKVEFPVAGATVTLLAPNGTVLAQQVTGEDGLYLFDELEAGNYRVEVCVGGGEYTTTNAAGVADDVDSDVFTLGDKPGCARTGLINLPEGVTDLTWDAGILIEVEGIQIEPTTTTAAPTTTAQQVTTTVEPVTAGTLPFTGFDVEDVVFISIAALALGSGILLVVRRREGDEAVDHVMSGWSNS